MSEFDPEQSSEYAPSSLDPKNEIVRISSDDWHEKRNGRFKTPERSVLTVVTTARYWAGRHNPTAKAPAREPSVGKNSGDDDLPSREVPIERPYRLAIIGYALHRELEKIFGIPIATANNVCIWPFKHFISYESRIRQSYANLQASIGKTAEDEASVDRGRKSDAGFNLGTSASEGMGIRVEDGNEGMTVNQEDDEPDYMKPVKLEVRFRKYYPSLAFSCLFECHFCINNSLERNQIIQDPRAKSLTQGQLKCVVQFMDVYMKEILSTKRKIEDHTLESIGFDYLWLLFKPGDLIFTSSTQKRAYVVLHVTGGRAILDIGDQPSTNDRSTLRPTQSWEQHEDQGLAYSHSKNTPFIIDTFYIDFNGDNFGPVPRKFVIQEYEGQEEITSLPVFPADFDKDVQKTKDMLIDRGKKFIGMAGVAHRTYAGLTAREPSVADFQEEVRERLTCDLVSFFVHVLTSS